MALYSLIVLMWH